VALAGGVLGERAGRHRGNLWAYFRLRDNGARRPVRIDWEGNATFAIGLSAIRVAVTYGIQSYDGHPMGWSNPAVIAGLVVGAALLAVFAAIERSVAGPLFQYSQTAF